MLRLTKIGVIGIFVALIFSSSAMAQRFAYIDSEKIINNFTDLQRAQETFQTEMNDWEDQASMLEKELNDLQAEYEKQKLILSADKKAERQKEIDTKRQALQAFTKDIGAPGGKAERRQMELMGPLYDRVTEAIEKVAIEEGYDFVFNSSGLAYAKKELDITDKVLDKLEEGQ